MPTIPTTALITLASSTVNFDLSSSPATMSVSAQTVQPKITNGSSVNLDQAAGAGDNGVMEFDNLMADFRAQYIETYRQPWNQFLITAYVPVFLLSLTGNALVLFVVLGNRSMRTTTNYFLLNLSVADLLVTLVCLPLTVGELAYRVWFYGEFLCRLVGYFQGVSLSASVLTITALSLERYLAIRHPVTSRRVSTTGRIRAVIAGIWTLACCTMVPLATVRTLDRYQLLVGNDSVIICLEQWPNTIGRLVFDIFIFIFIYLIPGSVVIVSYSITGCRLMSDNLSNLRHEGGGGSDGAFDARQRHGGAQKSHRPPPVYAAMVSLSRSEQRTSSSSCRTVLRSVSSTSGGGAVDNCNSHSSDDCRCSDWINGSGKITSRSSTSSGNRRAMIEDRITAGRRRVARMLIVVAVLFAVSWMPYHVISLYLNFVSSGNSLSLAVLSAALLLGHSQSAQNPIVYCVMSTAFRRAMIGALSCSRRRCSINEVNSEVWRGRSCDDRSTRLTLGRGTSSLHNHHKHIDNIKSEVYGRAVVDHATIIDGDGNNCEFDDKRAVGSATGNDDAAAAAGNDVSAINCAEAVLNEQK